MPGVKAYLLSLAIGVLVGVIYGLVNVRSPAPPVVALVGLLGILLGEQVVPIAKRMLEPTPAGLASVGSGCARHLFGALPGSGVGAAPPPPESAPPPCPE